MAQKVAKNFHWGIKTKKHVILINDKCFQLKNLIPKAYEGHLPLTLSQPQNMANEVKDSILLELSGNAI